MSRAHRRPLTAGNQLLGASFESSPMVPDKLQTSPQQAMGPNRIHNIESSPEYRAQVKENMEFALFQSLTKDQDEKTPTKFLLSSPSKSSPSPGKKIALLNALSLKYSGQDRQMIEKFVKTNQEVPDSRVDAAVEESIKNPVPSPSRVNDVEESIKNQVPVPSRVEDVEESTENADSVEVDSTITVNVNDNDLIHWNSCDLSLEEVLDTESATELLPDYVAYIQDKFEQDILDESFTIECLEVDWQNHLLLKNDDNEEHVPETESTETSANDRKTKILEYTRSFFKAEAEAMRREEEEYDHLCPRVEVAVDEQALQYGDKDCVAANRRFGNFAYVKLDKYFDCKYCKNKCFMDESLNDHLKYCRQYVHRNYNKLKERAAEKRRSKSKIFRQKDAKLNGEAKIRLEQFYYCPQSRQRFAMKSRNLRTHLKKCSLCRKPPNRECISCKKEFPSVFSLQEHINFVHGGMQSYRCDLCNEAKFRSVTQKEEHIAFYHLGIVPSYKRFQCTIKSPYSCYEKFFSLADRKKHEKECALLRSKPAHGTQQQVESPTANSPYRCSLCKAVFHARMKFLQHSFQSHPEAGGKVTVECPRCDKTFENMWQHNQHARKCKPTNKKRTEDQTKNEVSSELLDLTNCDKSEGPVRSHESTIPMDTEELAWDNATPVSKKLGRPRKSVTFETDGISGKKSRGKPRKSLLGHICVGESPRGRPRKDSKLGYTPVADKKPQGRPRNRTREISHDAVLKSPERSSEQSPSRVTSSPSKVFPYRSSPGTKSRPPAPVEVITITLD